jgi:hypothetical protein
LDGLALEDLGIFFIDFPNILWPFGIFSPFWYVVPKKSGNPGQGDQMRF